MSSRLSEPLSFAPSGDGNYIRYVKIRDLQERIVLVPYYDEDDTIEELYHYYYQNAFSEDEVVFVTMDKKTSPKRNFSIGFYTANIGVDDILFITMSE